MKTILLIICLLGTISLMAQPSLEKAKAYQDGKFFSDAIVQYEKFLKKTPDNIEALNGLALCYESINDYGAARDYYFILHRINVNDISISYKLANCYRFLCDFDSCLIMLDQVKKLIVYTPEEQSIKNAATEEASEIRSLLAFNYKNYSRLLVQEVSDINTPFSEFGIFYLDSMLYFSSMRATNSRIDQRTAQGYSDIYKADFSKWNFNKSRILKMPSKINLYDENEGDFYLDTISKQIYFTRCSGNPSRCGIYTAKMGQNGSLKKVNPLNINSKEYNTGHATFSSDGNKMIFVSDMPNGLGKRDLYVSTKVNDEWDVPVNLGATVNTSDDEMFPMLYNDSILFFASSGHNGFGGLDIFFSIYRNNSWTRPKHLKAPVNSGSDDFNLVFKDELTKGYFCSNRPGGKGSDDIYIYTGNAWQPTMSGIVSDITSGSPVANAMVILTSSNISDTVFTDGKGFFSSDIVSNKPYRVNIIKQGYSERIDFLKTPKYFNGFDLTFYRSYQLNPSGTGISAEGTVKDKNTQKPIDDQPVLIMGKDGYYDKAVTDTSGLYQFQNIHDNNNYTILMAREGYWTQSKTLDVPVLTQPTHYSKMSGHDLDFEVEAIEANKEFVINNIYYDFDKASLKEESKLELVKLVQILKDNPNLRVEISSHTDNRGNDVYNQDLSQRRAQSVVNFLIDNGIKKDRLIARGYGKSRPIIKEAKTEEDHALNRRTSFTIIGIGKINYDDFVPSRMGEKTEETPQSNASVQKKSTVFKVQIYASKSPLQDKTFLKKINEAMPELMIIEEKYPDGYYRYIAGSYSVYEEAKEIRDAIIRLGYTDCFISTIKN